MEYIELTLERKFLRMSSFFQTYRPPIIIDEIQKAPELFEQIKIMCDESEERGLFWLTGSGSWNFTVCQKMRRKALTFQTNWIFLIL